MSRRSTVAPASSAAWGLAEPWASSESYIAWNAAEANRPAAIPSVGSGIS